MIGGIVAAPLLMAIGFRAAVAFWPYPRGLEFPPAAGSFIEDREGKPLGAFVAADGQWHLPLEKAQISPHLLAATVAVEDSRFYDHAGVDWRSAAGSCWEDVRHLGIRRGGSTLTMQLQRLRDPRPRSLIDKFEQAVRAEQIEKRQSKEQILVEYVNRAPFGGNLVGAGAASWRYFGRPCRDLSLGEAALLAGLPQSPNRLRPDRHPTAAIARRNHVLKRMLATGAITPHQYDEAIAESLRADWRPLPQDEEMGLLPTLQLLAANTPHQTIRTTIDAAIQKQVYQAATDRIELLAPSGINAAAVVVLDSRTSQCLAAASIGTSRASMDFTRAARSTGSTLKPLIYAAAFDAGICTPKTPLNDSPAAWPGYVPSNYDGTFRGPIPAAEALAESRNIPALLLLQKVGTHRAVGVMTGFGLRTLGAARREFGLSLAIGGADATPLEIAEAYATLARGGIWKPVTFDLHQSSSAARVMREEPCWRVTGALSNVERTRSVTAEAAAHHVAWKTGTSSGHRDAWCAAITPERTVVVWLGNPTGNGAMSLIGTDAAAPLALQLIAALDPSIEDWPAVEEEKVPAPQLAPAPASRLVMASPERGQHFVLVSDLPADQQRVRLQATSEKALWWFVDDSLTGTGELVWWAPSAGTHRIRAVDEDGRTATTEIEVKGE